jgi:hypothetical protein
MRPLIAPEPKAEEGCSITNAKERTMPSVFPAQHGILMDIGVLLTNVSQAWLMAARKIIEWFPAHWMRPGDAVMMP